MEKFPFKLRPYFFSIVLLSSLLSCAGPTAYLDSKVDPHFSLNRAQAIYLALLEPATIEDKQFHNLLASEMKQAGFTITNKLTTDSLALFFNLNTDTSLFQSTLVLPSSTTTTGNIGLKSFTATTEGTQVVPYSEYITVKRIRLLLYRITNKGKPDLVWEGYLGTKKESLRYGASPAIQQLLRVIGKNFEGPVEMVGQSERTSQDSDDVKQLKLHVRTLQEQIQDLRGYDKRLDGSKSLPKQPESLDRKLVKLGEACDLENLNACVELGAIYQVGEGVTKNLEKATDLYNKACNADNPQGCAGLGMLYKEGQGVPLNHDRANDLLTKSCNLGYSEACYMLGMWFKTGGTGQKDEIRAIKLFQEACDGGQAAACTLLAFEYLSGKIVPRDDMRYIHFLELGCDGGQAHACGALAWANLLGGSKIPKDEQKAFSLFQKACTGGDLRSCTSLGRFYKRGKLVKKDLSKALTLFEKGCKGGDPSGCMAVGNAYLEGKQKPREPHKAMDFFNRACQAKEETTGWKSAGCLKLGSLYEEGKDEAQNLELAKTFYKKACAAGNETGCGRLGLLLIGKTESEVHLDEAIPLLRKGCQKYRTDNTCQELEELLTTLCEKGALSYCRELSDFYWKVAEPENAAIVLSLDQRLCDQGELESCYRSAFRYEMGTKGQTRDIEKAEIIHKKNCENGHAESCSTLSGIATYYLKGILGRPTDPQRAAELWAFGCKYEIYDACQMLGSLYKEGKGVEQNYIRAVELYQIACNEKVSMGCLMLGFMYEMGKGVEKIISEATGYFLRAADLRRKGCEAVNTSDGASKNYYGRDDGYNHYYDCLLLANQYKDGLGVSKDKIKAGVLYKRACDGGIGPQDSCKAAVTFYEQDCLSGNAAACRILGKMHMNGRFVKQDTQRALQLYEQACAGKDGDACYSLGNLYKRGKGPYHQPEKARSFFKKACLMGYSLGCTE